jgi:hypothetical protein
MVSRSSPTPTLPRKRERGPAAIVVSDVFCLENF